MEIDYESHNGTHFVTDRTLKGNIKVFRPEKLSDAKFAADCIEFGGWHGATIHPELNGFSGYDCINVSI